MMILLGFNYLCWDLTPYFFLWSMARGIEYELKCYYTHALNSFVVDNYKEHKYQVL